MAPSPRGQVGMRSASRAWSLLQSLERGRASKPKTTHLDKGTTGEQARSEQAHIVPMAGAERFGRTALKQWAPSGGRQHTPQTVSGGVVMSKQKSARSKSGRVARSTAAAKSALVVTVDELRTLLGIGRAAAYRLAHKLGVRIADGRTARLLVPRERLNEWLTGRARNGGAS